MILKYLIYVVIGLTFLAISADKLVYYAVSLAKHLKVSPFLVGIVIIGFGTSAPEMLVSALAALDNVGGIAIGNALGSNIANIGLVLGCTAIFSSLLISREILKVDISALFAITLLALFLLSDKQLTTIDGLIFAYLAWSAFRDKSSTPEDDEFDLEGKPEISLAKSATWTVINLMVLLVSSKVLLDGAIGISEVLGVSDLMVGLTVVAIGTSMPELAASIAAARQKQTGMIIGNIIGSNAFNTLGVLGIVGMLSNTAVSPEVLKRDFIVLILLMLLLAGIAFFKGKLTKSSGLGFLVMYFSYLGYLIYNALQIAS